MATVQSGLRNTEHQAESAVWSAHIKLVNMTSSVVEAKQLVEGVRGIFACDWIYISASHKT